MQQFSFKRPRFDRRSDDPSVHEPLELLPQLLALRGRRIGPVVQFCQIVHAACRVQSFVLSVSPPGPHLFWLACQTWDPRRNTRQSVERRDAVCDAFVPVLTFELRQGPAKNGGRANGNDDRGFRRLPNQPHPPDTVQIAASATRVTQRSERGFRNIRCFTSSSRAVRTSLGVSSRFNWRRGRSQHLADGQLRLLASDEMLGRHSVKSVESLSQ